MIKLQLLVRTLNWKRYVTTSTAFRFWNTHCNLIQMSWFFKVTELSQRISEDFQVCRKVVPCRKTFRRHYDPSKLRWLFTSRYGVTSRKTWIFVLILFNFGINNGTSRTLIMYAGCMSSNLNPFEAQYASYTFRHSRDAIIRGSLC